MLVDVCMYVCMYIVDLVGEWEERSFFFFSFLLQIPFFYLLCLIRRGLMSMA